MMRKRCVGGGKARIQRVNFEVSNYDEEAAAHNRRGRHASGLLGRIPN